MKHGLVEFYEGDSENTRDLDGARAFSDMFLWPGKVLPGIYTYRIGRKGSPTTGADVTLTLRSS